LITDSIGTTSGPSGSGTNTLANPGAILEYSYAGTLLPLKDDPDKPAIDRKQIIQVFPNPATQFIQIRFSDAAFIRPARYVLMDITGKRMMEGVSTQKEFRINTQGIKSGVYLLKLYNGYGLEVRTEKVVIRH
jgi:aldose sugar dehydrogenase